VLERPESVHKRRYRSLRIPRRVFERLIRGMTVPLGKSPFLGLFLLRVSSAYFKSLFRLGWVLLLNTKGSRHLREPLLIPLSAV
jgi:hypothetical protein